MENKNKRNLIKRAKVLIEKDFIKKMQRQLSVKVFALINNKKEMELRLFAEDFEEALDNITYEKVIETIEENLY